MLVNIIICIKKDIVLVPRKTCKKIQKGETKRGYMRKKMQYTYVEKRSKLFCDDYFFLCKYVCHTDI